MREAPRKITLEYWDVRYDQLRHAGLKESSYGGPLRRHVADGDLRLPSLQYDNSAAALQLWNFLLTEEERLHLARARGHKIIGTMKDLGTVPVMAYSLSNATAFYPDGAWWIPCVMQLSDGLLGVADSLGINESFCPVRAMLGAFLTEDHFPNPDLLICSVGATCDDFSAIAQRLNGLGYPILWWELPHRRNPDPDEETVVLPGGFTAPQALVEFTKSELQRIGDALHQLTGEAPDDDKLATGIRAANKIRAILDELRRLVFTADVCPMPALEMLIAEMLAIHYCSDRAETRNVLQALVDEVKRRIEAGIGVLDDDAVRIFWVNPVADIQVMNLLEDCGGRICGTDYLFCHALDPVPEDLPPLEALARMVLADPMVGSSADRADRICRDIQTFRAEALVVSRIPGASHCAIEGTVISNIVQNNFDIPVLSIEVPPVSNALQPALSARLEALMETARRRRTT